jgi:hypothetical protein
MKPLLAVVLSGLAAPIPYADCTPDNPGWGAPILGWSMTLNTVAPIGWLRLGPDADATNVGTVVSCSTTGNVETCRARGGFSNGIIAYLELPPRFAVMKTTLLDGPPGAAIAVAGPVPGDFNGDGVVDVIDLLILVNEVLGLSPCIDDVTGDGRCDVSDVETEVGLIL